MTVTDSLSDVPTCLNSLELSSAMVPVKLSVVTVVDCALALQVCHEMTCIHHNWTRDVGT